MKTTRGDLKPAVIYDAAKRESDGVKCMFNPFEYEVKKTNSFEPTWENSKVVPVMEYTGSTQKTLTLNLMFDTYETGENVSTKIAKLWDYMIPIPPKEGDKLRPPTVVFSWGDFEFSAVVVSLSQKFTLFTKDGTPVRAKVTITFHNHGDPKETPPSKQNPTSGADSVHELREVVRGDRLDLIAADVYGDATKWRLIAERNNINSPIRLRPGQRLIIPEESA